MLRVAVLAGLLAGSEPETLSRCNVPVFRYALERWPAGTFSAVVFHRGPLGGDATAALEHLSRAKANVNACSVDVAAPMSDRMKRVWDSRTRAADPCLVVLAPDRDDAVWWGPATLEAARGVVDSPARRDLVQRILSGDSAVWVVVESGDRRKDDAAASLLETELRREEQLIRLPDPRPDDPPLLSDVPLRIRFSALRVSRWDPGEESFVRMIVGNIDASGPLVVPVFGRGRALAAIAGAAIDPSAIRRPAVFLTGPCSCEAKQETPGRDLLLAADWEGLRSVSRLSKDPLPLPILSPRAAVTPEGQVPEPADAPAFRRWILWVALGANAVLIVLTAASLRPRRGPL